MMYTNDQRIVMTLDAGGTNFVFSAMQAGREIVDPISLSASGTTLTEILLKIIHGFEQIKSCLPDQPVAISFAFPGPADYKNGIIGDLQNLPLFQGGVALGPMLQNHFRIPVFINNDGDLFAYGEAIGGLLPEVNRKLAEAGQTRRYHNLLGVTFGTGFGGGIVSQGALFTGDNSAGGEINRLRNRTFKTFDAEESVSIRGVMREYALYAGINMGSCPEPKTIFDIGMGLRQGNREAAVHAFQAFAVAAGDALANAITLVDGLIVIGGGLSGAHPLFMASLVAEMNAPFNTVTGAPLDRLEMRVYNLEDHHEANLFYRDDHTVIDIPFQSATIPYHPEKRTGVGISLLGTSRAVSLGAYAFALHALSQ